MKFFQTVFYSLLASWQNLTPTRGIERTAQLPGCLSIQNYNQRPGEPQILCSERLESLLMFTEWWPHDTGPSMSLVFWESVSIVTCKTFANVARTGACLLHWLKGFLKTNFKMINICMRERENWKCLIPTALVPIAPLGFWWGFQNEPHTLSWKSLLLLALNTSPRHTVSSLAVSIHCPLCHPQLRLSSRNLLSSEINPTSSIASCSSFCWRKCQRGGGGWNMVHLPAPESGQWSLLDVLGAAGLVNVVERESWGRQTHNLGLDSQGSSALVFLWQGPKMQKPHSL